MGFARLAHAVLALKSCKHSGLRMQSSKSWTLLKLPSKQLHPNLVPFEPIRPSRLYLLSFVEPAHLILHRTGKDHSEAHQYHIHNAHNISQKDALETLNVSKLSCLLSAWSELGL